MKQHAALLSTLLIFLHVIHLGDATGNVTVTDAVNAYASQPTGTTSLVQFLITVAAIDVGLSLLIVIVICLPVILIKSAKVQKLAIKVAKGSVDRVKAGGNALVQGARKTRRNLVRDKEASVSSQDSKNPEKEVMAKTPSAAEMGGEKPASALQADGAEATSLTNTSTELDEEQLAAAKSFQVERMSSGSWRIFILWGLLAGAFFIAGAVCTVLGVVAIFSNSTVSVAVNALNASSLPTTVYAILIAGLVLIGVLDTLIILTLFFIRPKEFVLFGKWRWAPQSCWHSEINRYCRSLEFNLNNLFFPHYSFLLGAELGII